MVGLAKLAPGAGHVALAERPEPEAIAGHVVVEVVAAGICGTDLHIFDGEYASRPPVTMGHEVSGVVTELGEGVDESWRGARIVTETYFSTCGHCAWCREGRINLCPERQSIGSFVDGGFAPRLLVPARNLHRLSESVDGHAAAMAEPLACCCQSLLDPDRIMPGDSVLVVGTRPDRAARRADRRRVGRRRARAWHTARRRAGSRLLRRSALRRRRPTTAPSSRSTSSSSARGTRRA